MITNIEDEEFINNDLDTSLFDSQTAKNLKYKISNS